MQLDTRVGGKTKLTGLIGNPIEHTVSPVLHNTLFSMLGIDGIYLPVKVPPGRLEEAVCGLKASGFTGFNVTIPYKEEVLRYLDEVSEEALMLGAVNTIKISDNRLYGCNTDGDGFLRAFAEQIGEGFEGKAVCILGAGGTARTLSIKTATSGARKITVINRTPERARELSLSVNRVLEDKGFEKITDCAALGSREAAEAIEECDVLINTTSAGMYPKVEDSPLKDDFRFRKEQIIYDVIYNPAETKLLSQAKSSGCRTANGAGMLFYQGVRAFEIWMGMDVPDNKLRELSSEFLKYLAE
ncbi:MAG TPA: shikimate dehydrogenase [Clostridia bacterium]|nr:shikimate dehydrogenase [Clostridia bacterium]